jgi:hypothetical protein
MSKNMMYVAAAVVPYWFLKKKAAQMGLFGGGQFVRHDYRYAGEAGHCIGGELVQSAKQPRRQAPGGTWYCICHAGLASTINIQTIA